MERQATIESAFAEWGERYQCSVEAVIIVVHIIDISGGGDP